jgi:hypothetical protein
MDHNNFSVILSDSDTALLTSIEDYKNKIYAQLQEEKNKTANECDIILQSSKKEAALLLENLKIEYQEKFLKISKEMENANNKQLSNFFDILLKDINSIILKSCLKYFVKDSEMIRGYILDQMESYLSKGDILLTLNSGSMDAVKALDLESSGVKIRYSVDNSLDDMRLILSDYKASVYLSYDDVKSVVLERINKFSEDLE